MILQYLNSSDVIRRDILCCNGIPAPEHIQTVNCKIHRLALIQNLPSVKHGNPWHPLEYILDDPVLRSLESLYVVFNRILLLFDLFGLDLYLLERECHSLDPEIHHRSKFACLPGYTLYAHTLNNNHDSIILTRVIDMIVSFRIRRSIAEDPASVNRLDHHESRHHISITHAGYFAFYRMPLSRSTDADKKQDICQYVAESGHLKVLSGHRIVKFRPVRCPEV